MDWASFLPPFFGVLVAFLIQRAWASLENRSSKKKLLTDIKKELTSCSNLLVGKGNLVPTDIWKSAASSGSLKLVPHDRKFDLASIYFRIECHNYEAEKLRDVGILSESTMTEKPKAKWKFREKGTDKEVLLEFDRTDAQMLWEKLSGRLKNLETNLKRDIDDLLKQQKIWS